MSYTEIKEVCTSTELPLHSEHGIEQSWQFWWAVTQQWPVQPMFFSVFTDVSKQV